MDALESYLNDCANKRRRMRDRPSDEVLGELRMLLRQLKDARPPGRPESPLEFTDTDSFGSEDPGPGQSPPS